MAALWPCEIDFRSYARPQPGHPDACTIRPPRRFLAASQEGMLAYLPSLRSASETTWATARLGRPPFADTRALRVDARG